MPQKKLSFANLPDLDFGMIDKTFDAHVKAAANDCYDRPTDQTARKVVMTLVLKPQMSGRDLDSINAEVEFSTVLPKMRTKVYSMQPIINKGKADGLLFHPDLPDDPEGTSIQDLAERNGE